jgi:hypothetical protein
MKEKYIPSFMIIINRILILNFNYILNIAKGKEKEEEEKYC